MFEGNRFKKSLAFFGAWSLGLVFFSQLASDRGEVSRALANSQSNAKVSSKWTIFSRPNIPRSAMPQTEAQPSGPLSENELRTKASAITDEIFKFDFMHADSQDKSDAELDLMISRFDVAGWTASASQSMLAGRRIRSNEERYVFDAMIVDQLRRSFMGFVSLVRERRDSKIRGLLPLARLADKGRVAEMERLLASPVNFKILTTRVSDRCLSKYFQANCGDRRYQIHIQLLPEHTNERDDPEAFWTIIFRENAASGYKLVLEDLFLGGTMISTTVIPGFDNKSLEQMLYFYYRKFGLTRSELAEKGKRLQQAK